MIILGIDICFVAHLNSMAEAYFYLTMYVSNLMLMTVLLCLQ